MESIGTVTISFFPLGIYIYKTLYVFPRTK